MSTINNTGNVKPPADYYSPVLYTIDQLYKPYHIYIALPICILGVVANLLNVIVLCQPRLRNSTNLLLTALAVSDGILMLIYPNLMIIFFILYPIGHGLPHGLARFFIASSTLIFVFHAFSAWIIVVLALFRLLYIRSGIRAVVVCSTRRAWLAIVLVAGLSLPLSIPNFWAHSLDPRNSTVANNETYIQLYNVEIDSNPKLTLIVFITHAILIKGLPIILMILISIGVIGSLRQSQKRYAKLRKSQHRPSLLVPRNADQDKTRLSSTLLPVRADGSSVLPDASQEVLDDCKIVDSPNSIASTTMIDRGERIASIANDVGQGHMINKRGRGGGPVTLQSSGRNTNKTTNMLLLVIFFYIVTYLPQSALLLLNYNLGKSFQRNVYDKLGDLSDLLTLINNVVNFMLYCTMSKQFRTTFLQLFCCGSTA